MKLKDLKIGDRYRLPQHADEVCVYLGEVPHPSGVGTTHSFIFRGDEWNQDDGEFEVAELLESAEEGFSVSDALLQARREKYDVEVFRLLQCAADDAQKMMQSDWPQCATFLFGARDALQAATQLAKSECVGSYGLWVFQCQLELERMATNHPKYSREASLVQRERFLYEYWRELQRREPCICGCNRGWIADDGRAVCYRPDCNKEYTRPVQAGRSARFEQDEYHQHIYGEET